MLSSSSIPANGMQETKVDLEKGGKVTSHLVKYSHHPDGRAHFSQTGKIVTAIKRQSIALDTQHGHIFTLLIQGVGALDTADPVKDVGTSPQRTIIDFNVDSAESIKFVGRWFDVDRLRFSVPTPTAGPLLLTVDEQGKARNAIAVASPYANARHVLLLTCDSIPKLGPQSECFMFYGGFDPPEIMTDPTKEAGFLAFLYPLEEADKTRERIGTVDYMP
jgi:hypothetical protein